MFSEDEFKIIDENRPQSKVIRTESAEIRSEVVDVRNDGAERLERFVDEFLEFNRDSDIPSAIVDAIANRADELPADLKLAFLNTMDSVNLINAEGRRCKKLLDAWMEVGGDGTHGVPMTVELSPLYERAVLMLNESVERYASIIMKSHESMHGSLCAILSKMILMLGIDV